MATTDRSGELVTTDLTPNTTGGLNFETRSLTTRFACTGGVTGTWPGDNLFPICAEEADTFGAQGPEGHSF
jgi:hypothetical protein